MRKVTEHVKQLREMNANEDGRLKGEGAWGKYPLFWFQLFLSYKCTRRCNYCYAFNQVGDDNKAEMDEHTFSRLLEWIPEVWQANNVKVNSIGFLGGEKKSNLTHKNSSKKLEPLVYKERTKWYNYCNY